MLRPGVEELGAARISTSPSGILFLLNLLFPNHHTRAITAIVSEFAKRIRDELDFREEARNAATLRRNFAGEPRVVVPEVVSELVTRPGAGAGVHGGHPDRPAARAARDRRARRSTPLIDDLVEPTSR